MPAVDHTVHNRLERVTFFKHLTEQLLPARARAERWPLRLDHCFKRVCLDHAFGDVWYRHLRKPAEWYIEGEALQGAIRCAEEILEGGLPVLRERNRLSLQYRGKLKETS